MKVHCHRFFYYYSCPCLHKFLLIFFCSKAVKAVSMLSNPTAATCIRLAECLKIYLVILILTSIKRTRRVRIALGQQFISSSHVNFKMLLCSLIWELLHNTAFCFTLSLWKPRSYHNPQPIEKLWLISVRNKRNNFWIS